MNLFIFLKLIMQQRALSQQDVYVLEAWDLCTACLSAHSVSFTNVIDSVIQNICSSTVGKHIQGM